MPPKKNHSDMEKQHRATARPATGVPEVLKLLEALARTVESLQQEVRETHFTLEMRLENLELRVAEIQAELTRKKNRGVAEHSSSHH